MQEERASKPFFLFSPTTRPSLPPLLYPAPSATLRRLSPVDDIHTANKSTRKTFIKWQP